MGKYTQILRLTSPVPSPLLPAASPGSCATTQEALPESVLSKGEQSAATPAQGEGYRDKKSALEYTS